MRLFTSRRIPALFLLATSFSLAAWAQPGDGEFRVNTGPQAKQRNTAVAFAADGTFAVAWEDVRSGISVRVLPGSYPSLDPAARVAGEILLVGNQIFNNNPGEGTIFARRDPALLFLPSGDFYLFWTEERAYLRAAPFYEDWNTLDMDVFAQRFNRTGQALSRRFRVNRDRRGLQQRPRVAATPAGGFLVAWDGSDGAPGNGRRDGVFARLFNARGVALGDDLKLAGDIGVAAENPAIAAGSNGFLVAWEADGDGTDGTDVFGLVLDAKGAPVGSAMRLNSGAAGDQHSPAVAWDGTGGQYLVVWHGPNGEPLEHRVFGQMVGAGGSLLGPELQVSSGDGERAHALPEVASADGGFLVAWLLWKGDFQTAVAGVRLDSTGNPAGEPFRISEIQTSSRTLAMAAAPDGDGYLVSWEGFTDGDLGISARHVPAGDPDVPQVFLAQPLLAAN